MHVKRMLNEHYLKVDFETMFWAFQGLTDPREGMASFMEKREPNWIPEQFQKKRG